MRLDDLDEHLIALAERQRALLNLGSRALESDREVVEREAFGALEQERLAGLRLERVQHARAVAGELSRHARVDLHEERLDVRMLGRDVAQAPLELDRERLL